MRIDFFPAQPRLRLDEPLKTTVRLHNEGGSVLRVCPDLAACHLLVNGAEEDFVQSAWGGPGGKILPGSAAIVDVAPGASADLTSSFEVDLRSLVGGTGLETLTYELRVRVVVDGEVVDRTSGPLKVEVDLRETTPILTADGGPTPYVLERGRIVYVSPFSRAYEPATKVLKIDRATMRALDHGYLIDKSTVVRNGRPQRGVRPEGFRVLNAVFAGNAEIILTSYGDAKVEDPATFEALDDGRNSHLNTASYAAGFGRDRAFAYFFDESTSTKHAVRLRSCRDVKSFESLSHGYARDASHVYCESNRIKGADPATWTLLNRQFSRDAKAVFYGIEVVPGADLATFAVVDEPGGRERFDSLWAADKGGYFHRGERKTEADFEAARVEWEQLQAKVRRPVQSGS